MSKKLKLILLFWILFSAIFFAKDIYIFKKIDITKQVNYDNRNLPFFIYNFQNVSFFKWVNTKFNCVYAYWKMQEIWTTNTSNFEFSKCFSAIDWKIEDFENNNILLNVLNYCFFTNQILHLNDDDFQKDIYSISKNKVILWLYNIWNFTDVYMWNIDDNEKEVYNILKHIDKVPHISINFTKF